MNRRLTLLRHAKSSWQDDLAHDRDRPLTNRGKRDAPMMGQRMLARGTRPSLILTSPAVRARHTAQFIAREIGYPQEFLQCEEELYLATADQLARVLARQDDSFHDIVVCGHNPGLTDLANRLTGADIVNIATCGMVVMDLKLRSWTQIASPRARGTLALFDFPRQTAGEA